MQTGRPRGVLGGLVVIAMAVPFILQPLGVPNAPSYLFLTMGAAFAAAYLRSGRQYVYLVPAAILVAFGVGLLLPTWIALRPQTVGSLFLIVLSVGLASIFVLDPSRRWPLVPAGLLGAVAVADLVGGVAILPATLQPFFVPGVLAAVGVYLLLHPGR